jgi:hypothetical protein
MPMKYDASSIQVLEDPLAFIRRRREMFVGPCVHPQTMALGLAGDALFLGATEVEIHRWCNWWIVASSHDWLTSCNSHDLQETFNRIIGRPDQVNGCRSEVVIHALCGSVFSIKSGELVVIKGDKVLIQSLLSQKPLCEMGEKRIVGFAMAGTEDPGHHPNN